MPGVRASFGSWSLRRACLACQNAVGDQLLGGSVM